MVGSIYGYYLSSLITVVLDTSLVSRELLPPRRRATRTISKTAPPTTHTHGSVYHVVVSVVVLRVVTEVEVVSWANNTTWIKLKNNTSRYWPARMIIDLFISVGF